MAGYLYRTDPDGGIVLLQSAPPNGAAGGDLSGNFPNPNVAHLSHVTDGSLTTAGIQQNAVGILRANFSASADFFANASLSNSWNGISTNGDVNFTVGKSNSIIIVQLSGGPQFVQNGTGGNDGWVVPGYVFDSSGVIGSPIPCGQPILTNSSLTGIGVNYSTTFSVNNLSAGSHVISPRIYFSGASNSRSVFYWRPGTTGWLEWWKVSIVEIMV